MLGRLYFYWRLLWDWRDDAADSAETPAYVSAYMQGAHEAVRAQDIERVVECLSTAVAIYEQHPSCVHEPKSQLRDLLVLIRSARSLSNTLKRPENDLLELEERAEALRQSALH